MDFSGGLNILTGKPVPENQLSWGVSVLPWAEDIQQICFVREPIKGLVELTFYVENPETVRKLEEMDLSPDGGQIIITRRFNGNRSVSRINGETVTLGRLKEATRF